jgi:hypothetical protein
MGVTYKAFDVLLQRSAALKIITARLIGDDSAWQLFGRRKIDTLCSLSFSNIKTAEERVAAIACEREHWWQRMRDFDPPIELGFATPHKPCFVFV